MQLITLLKRFRIADYLGLDRDFTGAVLKALAVGRLVSLHPSRAFVVADDCNTLCLLTWLAVFFTHNIKEGKLVSTDETREALLRSDG